MPKGKVFLTGASGTMGGAAFLELLKKRDKYDIVLLIRPSKKNKKAFAKYEGDKSTPVGKKGVVEHDGIKIVWGDLTNYEDVLKAVNGVDYVLHPASFISPAADYNPPLTEKINIGSAKNIIRAIKAQPNSDEIRFVNIASNCSYGNRPLSVRMIRVGDPLRSSVYDFYATTKIAAERAVIESGLKYWASIRQTGIMIPDVMGQANDPIMFHPPIDMCMEAVTPRDAGYGLVQCLECPDDFYGKIYNMSDGPPFRVVFWQFTRDSMEAVGMGDFRKIMERNWFPLRNFHCGWYEDSDVLNDYLHHWRDSKEDYLKQVSDAAPWKVKLGKIVPKSLIKRFVMKKLAMKPYGPLNWIKNNNEGRIKAFFKSKKEWENIPDWDVDMPGPDDVEPHLLDHGYDEDKELKDLTINDMQKAAKFRGGECLSKKYDGNPATKLKWKCAFGHKFDASPTLVLKGGHWCPECAPPPWNYSEIAKKNKFLAQVYYSDHDEDEMEYYDERCFYDVYLKG